MSEWKETTLSEIVQIIPGYAFKGKHFGDNGILIVKIKDINPPYVDLNSAQKVDLTNYQTKNLDKYKLEQGQAVLAMTGATIGKIGILREQEEVYVNQRVAKIAAKDGFDYKFAIYSISGADFQTFIQNNSDSNSAQENISATSIGRYPVLLPPLPEQRAIASVLSSLDDKIDLLHRQNKTLEQMAETLFRQWFVEEDNGDWEERPLSGIATFLNGLACQKFPPKNEIDKLPVLKIRELKDGFTANSDWATTEVDEKYLVSNGDIIFSWSASLLVKIWDGEDCVLNQHLFKVTSKEFPKWFYYLWSKYHLDQFIAIAKAHATTMGHIKRGDLDEALVFVPSPEEIEEMNKTFEPIIEKIIANNNQLNVLVSLRETLLPKLMSGEIRVEQEA